MKKMELFSRKCSEKTEYLVDFQFIVNSNVDFPVLILNDSYLEITEYDSTEGINCLYVHVYQHFSVSENFILELEYDEHTLTDITTIQLKKEDLKN